MKLIKCLTRKLKLTPLIVLSVFLTGCSGVVNISSDPDFYRSEWKKNKGALFPVSALNSQDTPSISEQETFYKNFAEEEFFSTLSLGERNKYFFSPQGLQYISALRENYILTKTPHLAILNKSAKELDVRFIGFAIILDKGQKNITSHDNRPGLEFFVNSKFYLYDRKLNNIVFENSSKGTFTYYAPEKDDPKDPLAIEVLSLFLGDNRNSEEIAKDSYASALDKSLNDHRRSLSAQFNGECLKGDCKNGNGTFLVYNGGRIYKGPFKNFKANGKGTLKRKDEIQTLNFVDGYSQD